MELILQQMPVVLKALNVGFRKGSDLAQALNDFFLASYEDGTMEEIAETYGVQLSLIDQTALAAEAADGAEAAE